MQMRKGKYKQTKASNINFNKLKTKIQGRVNYCQFESYKMFKGGTFGGCLS